MPTELSDRAEAKWFPDADPPVVQIETKDEDDLMGFSVYLTPSELDNLGEFNEEVVADAE